MDLQIVPIAEASVKTLIEKIDKVIINPIIIFLFAVAMVYFLYGVAQYFLSGDSEEVRKKSKSQMLWGIIGLFIMVAVFGIMRIILNTVGENKIQVNSNGDFTVKENPTDANLTDQDVVDNKNTGQNLFKPPVDISIDKNAPDLPASTFTTNPFPTYKKIPTCWNEPIPGKKATTEFDATAQAVTAARAQYLLAFGANAVDIGKKDKFGNDVYAYPVIFQTKVLYDKKNKVYYAWVDARAPTQATGTISDCSKLEIIAPAPLIASSAITSDQLNLSTTVLNNTATSFTTSPFIKQYIPNALCWRQTLPDTASTEYQALQRIKAKVRSEYVKATGLLDSQVAVSLPKIYATYTVYDKANKIYYAWLDARGPINGGKASDCDLMELPMQADQSTKPNPLMGIYTSDPSYFRVMDSGVDPTYVGARSKAIHNALVQIARLKGLNTINGFPYTILPEEKYYGKDPLTGNIDYWLAVQSLR